MNNIFEKLITEDFKDKFQPITDEEMHQRFENMSAEELAEYINEEVLLNLRVDEYSLFFCRSGRF